MLVQEPVKAAIWHCLNHYDYKNAVFLAERLCAEIETDESIFILATSYFRSQQIQQAFWLLKEKSRRSPHCRYLLAKCAYQLKCYAEAETALSSCNFGELKHFDDIIKEFGEIACFAIYLIAQICIKTERTKIATDALHAVLKLNPFLWHAFTELCLLDDKIDIANIFSVKNDHVFKTCQSNVNFMHTSILFSNDDTAMSTVDANNEVIFLNQYTQQQQHKCNKNNKLITAAGGLLGGEAITPSTPTELYQTPNNNANNNNNNNNNNLNSSLNLLLGKTESWDNTPVSVLETPQHDVAKLQAAHTLAHMDEFAGTNQSDASIVVCDGDGNESLIDTPFKRNFKYLQSNCPLTPSFGVLPLSPRFDTPLIGAGANATTMTVNLHTPISLDMPKEQKPARKVTREGMAYALAPTPRNNNNGTPRTSNCTVALSQTTVNRQQQLPQTEFTPTSYRATVIATNNNNPATVGNNNNNNNNTNGNNISVTTTTTTTNNNNNNNNNNTTNINAAVVRRSSRLFGNNFGNSVKENSKTPQNISAHSKFAAPRSPPRKTKPRIPKICLNNELIDDKYAAENKKIETTTNKIDKRKIVAKLQQHQQQHEQQQCEQKRANAGRASVIATPPPPPSQQQQQQQLNAVQQQKIIINNTTTNTAQKLKNEILKLKQHSAEGLMQLLREMGTGYKLLFTYNCKEALKYFETQLPNHHFNSCWLQSLIGVAHYELRQYEDAIKVFKAIREVEPYRLEYMEFYSSSLWHLQRDVEMSALAHDLINLNKLSPVTWCVAGNCFSLHKEHETAIKFFKRAVQIDPDFVYSYTLLGHELLLAEDLDKSMDYFRYAIMRDPRHYYAWFGMGTIYSKQEKYELAELHYMRALKINPQNSVILVHIGAMQYFMGKKEKALTTLNSAALLEPRDPLSRFHRASIYFSLGRHQEALDELEELKKLVPKESVVFYLIGKIHKQLGNADLALMHFSWATDLDPKGANNQIKDVFDSMAPQNCCSNIGDDVIEEAVSEGSEDSTTAHPELNYDSDVY